MFILLFVFRYQFELLIFQDTCLTGLKVCERPHFELTTIYNRILSVLNEMPTTAVYRKHTEAIVKQRLAVVETVCFYIYVEFSCNQMFAVKKFTLYNTVLHYPSLVHFNKFVSGKRYRTARRENWHGSSRRSTGASKSNMC